MSPVAKTPLTIEHALLGFLTSEPIHAYEIYLHMRQAQALGLVWHVKQSQLYALLARLEQAEYITSSIEVQGTRPPRKMMQLTSGGKQAFAHWLNAPVRHGREFRLEFLAKLYFAQRHDSIGTLIAAQQHACHQWHDQLQAQLEQQGAAYDRLVLQFRIGQIEAILSWLEICRATLIPTEAA